MIPLATLLAPLANMKLSTKIIIGLLIVILLGGGFIAILLNRNAKLRLDNSILENNVSYYQDGMEVYKTKDSLNGVKIGKLEMKASDFKKSNDSLLQYLADEYGSLPGKRNVNKLNSITQIEISTGDKIPLVVMPKRFSDTTYRTASYEDKFITMELLIPETICIKDSVGIIEVDYVVHNEILVFDQWDRIPAKFLGKNWNWLGIGKKKGIVEIKTTNPNSVINNAQHVVLFNKNNKKKLKRK